MSFAQWALGLGQAAQAMIVKHMFTSIVLTNMRSWTESVQTDRALLLPICTKARTFLLLFGEEFCQDRRILTGLADSCLFVYAARDLTLTHIANLAHFFECDINGLANQCPNRVGENESCLSLITRKHVRNDFVAFA